MAINEKFFILTPTPSDKLTITDEKREDGLPTEAAFGRYLNADGKPLKWSGKMPLPAIGDRIYLRINSIGYGRVAGYAEVEDFVGLIVEPESPPDWYVKQTKAQKAEHEKALKLTEEKRKIERLRLHPKWILDGLACVFGAEISLKKGAE